MVLGLRDLTRSVSAWAIAAEVVVGGGCGRVSGGCGWYRLAHAHYVSTKLSINRHLAL